MRNRPGTAATLAALLLLAAPMGLPAQTEVYDALLKNDPVSLTEGIEQKGLDTLFVTRGRFRYFFQTEENRAAFMADPRRYALQMGGGCGRMGPLSGTGDPSRWAVHEGRIYIFASEGCRTGFLASPERFIDRPSRAKGQVHSCIATTWSSNPEKGQPGDWRYLRLV